VITQANGQAITDQDSLNNIIQTLSVGNTLTLRVVRDGQTRTVTVTMRERPATFGQDQRAQQQQQQQQQDPNQQGQPQSPFGLP